MPPDSRTSERNPKLEYQFFEQLVFNLMRAAGVVPDMRESIRELADFAFQRNHRRFLVEVKRDNLSADALSALASRIAKAPARGKGKFKQFILVTPNRPRREILVNFQSVFKGIHLEARWVGVDTFARFLGVGRKLDFASPKTHAYLQAAATTKEFTKYSISVGGAGLSSKTKEMSAAKVQASPLQIPPEWVDLARQFSYPSLKELSEGKSSLEEALCFGKRYPEAIVVLSDIKNFSSFVKAAQPDVLNECMAKYYQIARELVWKHRGVLDKFIGDAVLAIFNYPLTDAQSPRHALQFCVELIKLGRSVTSELTDSINEIIQTGTRIGVSTGPLWPLNIGSGHVEVSFVGDVINLSARLEKKCAVDGVLIENRMRSYLRKSEPLLESTLPFKSRVLTREQAKGQLMDIQAWQLDYQSMIAPLAT